MPCSRGASSTTLVDGSVSALSGHKNRVQLLDIAHQDFQQPTVAAGTAVRFNDLGQRVDQPHHLWPPQPLVVAAWFHWVVAGSLIAFSAYMLRLARASTALATGYCLVTPVIALFLGVAFAGEVITNFEWATAGAVLVGVVLALRGRRD
jgi:hypothetical protein